MFPILVAALSAREGDLLLIENPEVHLHPSGQAMMGEFLSRVASTGVQVIVESHSDHILNGIRKSVKLGTMCPEDVGIFFFQAPTETNPQVVNPLIDTNGNLDYWPDGFFDQYDKDMSYFAGWGLTHEGNL